MGEHPAAMPHGAIDEVFEDVFMVTGTMRNEFFGSMWQFSRNMVVVRDDGALTLINAVRLDDEGLAALDALGAVKHVVRIGSMHGHDDPFYVEHYGATYWALPSMPPKETPPVDRELRVGGELPFPGASLFSFEATKLPEGILRLDRDGGILIACDSLQNWLGPDEFFDESTVEKMSEMGFFAPANLGPAWVHANDPKPDDFVRLKEIEFRHVLCAHGSPLRNTAMPDFHSTFARVFDI